MSKVDGYLNKLAIDRQNSEHYVLPPTKKLIDILPEYEQILEFKKQASMTGYNALDRIIGGIIPGNLITVTGNTSVGKTTFVSNIVANLIRNDRRVLYFALEPRTKIITTLASIIYDRSYSDVESTPDIYHALANDYKTLDYHDKRGFRSIDDVAMKINSLDKYDLIVIDHMGYFTTSTDDNATAIESSVINKLAEIAYNNKTTIINIAHTNKEAHSKSSLGLADLKGAISIVQDSTDVVVVEREAESDNGIVKVIKTKNGSIGAFEIVFSVSSASIVGKDQILTAKDIDKENRDKQISDCAKSLKGFINKYPDISIDQLSLYMAYEYNSSIVKQTVSRLLVDDEISYEHKKLKLKRY